MPVSVTVQDWSVIVANTSSQREEKRREEKRREEKRREAESKVEKE
jgi:hypothetical protein